MYCNLSLRLVVFFLLLLLLLLLPLLGRYRPRDRFTTLLRFLPAWFGYAINATTIEALWGEGRKSRLFIAPYPVLIRSLGAID